MLGPVETTVIHCLGRFMDVSVYRVCMVPHIFQAIHRRRRLRYAAEGRKYCRVSLKAGPAARNT